MLLDGRTFRVGIAWFYLVQRVGFRRSGFWRGTGSLRREVLLGLVVCLCLVLNWQWLGDLLHGWTLSQPITLDRELRWSCFRQSHERRKPNSTEKIPTFLLVLVKSAPWNWHRRLVLRETWVRSWRQDSLGSWITPCHYRVYFVVGQARAPSLDASIAAEANRHGDMWLPGFRDTYTGLRQKVIWSFAFALHHFQFVYLMSADDDSFVNMPSLLHWLAGQPKSLFYGGALVVNGKVRRVPGSKWSVDNNTFPDEVYPPYMYGAGYVISEDVARVLADKKSYGGSVEKFWIDDVLVGIVLRKRLPSLIPVNCRHFYGFLSQWPKACKGLDAALIGNVPVMKMVRYHINLKDGRSLC